ncbi:hypothetical protein C5614_30025 [Massilia phosphatilytica]|nr:hypothetical protein C5614_30025 [Massilia phosphatilytica]
MLGALQSSSCCVCGPEGDLPADVLDYIERFYNRRRRHSTISYISPVQFENLKCTTSADHERQAAKEGESFVGGAIGGAVGSAAVLAMVSNPAGWVVGAAMFVGAMDGGLGSSELFDYFWPER